jgi:hypothetical protein
MIYINNSVFNRFISNICFYLYIKITDGAHLSLYLGLMGSPGPILQLAIPKRALSAWAEPARNLPRLKLKLPRPEALNGNLYITLKVEAPGRVRHTHMLLFPQQCLGTVDPQIQYLSTKPGRQSTEGYAQGSRLSADRCASHERDGDAEQHAGLPRFRPPCGRNTLRPALLCYCCLEQCITS